MRARFIVIVCAGTSCLPIHVAFADDEPPAVTPYRPTVSTPATVSAPGWLEGEFGAMQAFGRRSDDPDFRRGSIPYTIKYAFTPDWGIRVGGEALVRARDDDGRHETGFGDTGIIVKRRFAVDDDSAFGLEAGVLFPTARRALQTGSGQPDWSVNGIYSADLGHWHVDVNVVETRQGERDDDAIPSSCRWQTLGALAVSHPLTDRWGLTGEWSGTRQTGIAGTAQFLGGFTFTPRRDIVFDVGVVRGINRATPTWQAFAGVTLMLGRLQ